MDEKLNKFITSTTFLRFDKACNESGLDTLFALENIMLDFIKSHEKMLDILSKDLKELEEFKNRKSNEKSLMDEFLNLGYFVNKEDGSSGYGYYIRKCGSPSLRFLCPAGCLDKLEKELNELVKFNTSVSDTLIF